MKHNAETRSSSPPAWFVRAAGDGAWMLVKASGIPASVLGALTETTEAKPRPPIADDPRPSFERNVGGGFWVG